jgi:glucose-6-phosphate-specific signal transduction histidine kinase
VRIQASNGSRLAQHHGTTKKDAGDKPATDDIEQLAREIYDEIRRLMEAARERNGDPWL